MPSSVLRPLSHHETHPLWTVPLSGPGNIYALGSDGKIRRMGGEVDNLAGWWGVPSKEHPLSGSPSISLVFMSYYLCQIAIVIF